MNCVDESKIASVSSYVETASNRENDELSCAILSRESLYSAFGKLRCRIEEQEVFS